MEKISNYFLAGMILLIVGWGIKSKAEIFEEFVKGAEDASKMIMKIFPTMLGLFISVSFIRNSGLLDLFKTIIKPVASIFGIPEEIIPLVLVRPISGSASLAIVADIFKNYGVDSKVGVIASIMMGTTETIIYVIAVYFGVVGIKNLRYILFCALMAEFLSVILSVGVVNVMMK